MKRIIVYNSHTGFTRRYAQQVAEKIDGQALPLFGASRNVQGADALIFGTRAHCGTIDKLSHGVRLLK